MKTICKHAYPSDLCGTCNPIANEKPLCPSNATTCSHRRRIYVADTAEGMGHIAVYWCPDCGGLKKRMTNWKFTDYPWQIPSRANS
jgi:hypothetical protein